MIDHDNKDSESSNHGDPLDLLRERTHTDAHSLLEMEPWADFRGRSTLLMIDPPAVQWATMSERNTIYLILEGADARALPRELRENLLRYGSLRRPADIPIGNIATDLYVFTFEHLRNTLEGTGRRSLETRWSVRHADPLADPLHQQETLVALSIRLPHDGLERIVRPLYLRSRAALHSLEVMTMTEASSSLVAPRTVRSPVGALRDPSASLGRRRAAGCCCSPVGRSLPGRRSCSTVRRP